MSFSLMMPQKYCGFSTKLDRPESSSEEGGLLPKFMNRNDTANSSSVPNTDEPDERGKMWMARGRCGGRKHGCETSAKVSPTFKRKKP